MAAKADYEAVAKEIHRRRMEEMEAFLETAADAPWEYDDLLVRKLIEKITIYDDRLAVEFKSGIETEVEI